MYNSLISEPALPLNNLEQYKLPIPTAVKETYI